MSSVDLRIVSVTLLTIGAYTLVANIIPQVESEVPPDVAFGAEVTPDELVEVGQQLYEGAGGCVACHAETPGARAPNLQSDYEGEGPIGARCGERIPDLACKEYLHEALVDPTGHLVDDYPPIMPPVDRTMNAPQIWALVAYLESLGGEVTVTAADIPDEPESAGGAPGDGDAAAGGAGAAGPGIAATEPEEIIRELCVQCHVLGEEGTALGPPFEEIAERRSAEEIRLAILQPSEVISDDYADLAGLMPQDFGRRMNAEQLESVVRYITGLR